MSRDVELPSFILRRVRASAALNGQTPPDALVEELKAFGADQDGFLVAQLLGHNERGVGLSVIERVLSQVERGWVSVRRASSNISAGAGPEPEAPVDLVNLVAKEDEATPAPTEPAPPPAAHAQVGALAAASESGVPFCEICNG